MIRLYGHLSGSFATVSEGLRQAFEELGVLSGYVISETEDFTSETPPGAMAPIAVVVGDPMRVHLAHTRGMHRDVWLMLAPNSEGVPARLKQQLSGFVSGLLAPSVWAKAVLEREFPSLPVRLCRHGVLPDIIVGAESSKPQGQPPYMLHLTSTRLARKSTRELVQAWQRYAHPDLRLLILSNPRFASEYKQEFEKFKKVSVINGQNLPYSALGDLYRQAKAVIQPSRAEGFGLVPLEALACGTPVIATYCTGHADFLPSVGSVRVHHGFLDESDDYWGATAPSVSVQSIHEALLAFETFSAERETISNAVSSFTWANGAIEVVSEWRKC